MEEGREGERDSDGKGEGDREMMKNENLLDLLEVVARLIALVLCNSAGEGWEKEKRRVGDVGERGGGGERGRDRA